MTLPVCGLSLKSPSRTAHSKRSVRVARVATTVVA